jgi:arginine/lysine/ornithine decarboxylase
MDQSEAPLLDALIDYRQSNRYGFTPPGHRQGRGTDDRVLEVLGQEPFRDDVLASGGLDDRRTCISLGPAVVADDIDEIVADERWVEMLEYVSVDVSESAVRAVFVAVVERSQYPALEIWSWVGGGDGVKRL